MKTCSKCGAENRPGAKFCGNCRAPFAVSKPRFKRPRNSHILAGAAIIVVGAVGFYFISNYGSRFDEAAAAKLTIQDIYKRGTDAYNAKNYQNAMNWFKAGAAKGDFASVNWVGWLYQNGLGVKTDNNAAVMWYHQAADKGFAPSETNLGWAYQSGLGVPQDYHEAMKYYRMAAEQKNESAEINVGFMYETGLGVAPDDAEARKWYKTAADQGSQEAQKDLDVLEAKQVNLSAIHPKLN